MSDFRERIKQGAAGSGGAFRMKFSWGALVSYKKGFNELPKIEEIDQNFKQNTDESGLLYIDCFTAPVRISGLPWKEKNQNYHRMDDSLNHLYNFGVRGLSPCTVDSLHPNDFGFMRMAQVILPVLEEALGASGD